MEELILRSARQLASDAQARILRPGDTAVDCTVGNGHDTCFLASLVGETGTVYGFDLQADAVERTRVRLREAGLLSRCRLIHAGHERIADHVREPVRCIVFNLGWLPGGDKSVTTRWETTRAAILASLELLQPLGMLTVCAYPGHPAGEEELNGLQALFAGLRPQEYNVLHQRFLNAGPGAPECFLAQRQDNRRG